MDLEYGLTANCQNIYLYKNNNTTAQQWYINPFIKSDTSKLNQLAAQNKNVLPDGTYTIKNNKNKNYVLDVLWASSSNNANIQLYLKNDSAAQAFKVTHDSNGYVTFTNLNSGKVIDVNMNKAELGQNIAQNESKNVKGQKWIVQRNGSGYNIISALDPDYVMDLAGGSIFSGGNIQLYENNNSDAQRWVFEKFMTDRDVCDTYAKENKNLMEDGTYYIKNKDINYSLDISNESLYSGANVQLNSLKRSNTQKWIITHDSMGYVSFKNVGTGMYLTANGNTKESNVSQQTNSNDYNQKWIIMFDKNQKIKIVSALNSKLVIDVLYGNIKDGSNIQLYDSNNTNAQKWVFEYVNINSTSDLMQIMGTSQTTVAQMVRYYNANTSGYDTFKAKYNGKYDGCLAKGGASTINQFAQIFYEEAMAEGVRAEVAFTQCMKETGFLKYGGDVLPNQYNFAGIGATGEVHGASFSNVRMGIRAQIQHLKAYASLDGLTNPCVDPRFNLVKRGSAQYVEWLGTKENPNGYGWATSKNYGHDIVNMVNVLLKK